MLPPLIYPPQALRARVEGSVASRSASAPTDGGDRRWPFPVPNPCEMPPSRMCGNSSLRPRHKRRRLDVGFSLRDATHSFVSAAAGEAHHTGVPGKPARLGAGGSDGRSARPRGVRAAGDRAGNTGARRGGIGPSLDVPADAAQWQTRTRHSSGRRAVRPVAGLRWASNQGAAQKRSRAVRLICVGFLNAIDDDAIYRPFLRLQFEPELLLHCGQEVLSLVPDHIEDINPWEVRFNLARGPRRSRCGTAVGMNSQNSRRNNICGMATFSSGVWMIGASIRMC